MKINKFEHEISGRKLTVEVGRLANQTHGSCTVRYGDTIVLATAVMGNLREGDDFFPLTVDFEERLYAAGKIKGSRFMKREGRPSDEAILSSRLVDRSIRPLFDERMRNEIQVVLTVFSVDGENDSDFPALVAASIALSLSKIPWNGPIGGVAVAYHDGQYTINPTTEQLQKAELELFVSGTENTVLMIEALGKQADEAVFMQALSLAQREITSLVNFIAGIQKEIGAAKETIAFEESEEKKHMVQTVKTVVDETVEKNIGNIFGNYSKTERQSAEEKLLDEILKKVSELNLDESALLLAEKLFEEKTAAEAIALAIRDKKRVDGRALDEVRALSCEVGLLPRTHGSGLFNRGETQVMSIVTLGAPSDEQTLEGMEENGSKRYMHHYNFPGFCVGEVKPIRSPGRREIGHGALAEKALVPVLPDKAVFPYTTRVVSEVLSSNGSSSQASICGSTLALMDAGVPILAPVAGIAMGIMIDESGTYEILTDIQGVEDHSGFMDFKVAGTKTGMTAVQLDVKNRGLSLQMCEETLAKAKKARHQILDVMSAVIAEPRKELSPYAPRILTLQIDPEKIGEVIGKGGETINAIIDECGGKDMCKIDIEDDGLVLVTAKGKEGERAIEIIKSIVKEIMPGEVYEGRVVKIVTDRMSGKEIGAVVELAPGKDGMVHISELSHRRVPTVSDEVSLGDTITVKVVSVDREKGRVSLSRKAMMKDDFKDQKFHGRNDDFSS